MLSTFNWMSNILLSTLQCSEPTSSTVTDIDYSTSVVALQGGRQYMEDEHVISFDGRFAGVFDGHGGNGVSKHIQKNIYEYFMSELPEDKDEWTDQMIMAAMDTTLKKIDAEVCTQPKLSYTGSTLVLSCINKKSTVVFAKGSPATARGGRFSIITMNVGDSRCVLARGHSAVDLTVDHKPDAPSERIRIEKFGGHVELQKNCRHPKPVYRVNGNLSVARSVGDVLQRPCVCGDGDIRSLEGSPDDHFIVTASDGLWDVLSSQEVVTYVNQLLGQIVQIRSDCDLGADGDTVSIRSAAMTAISDRTGLEFERKESRSQVVHRHALMIREKFGFSLDELIDMDGLQKSDFFNNLYASVRKNMASLLATEAIRRRSGDNITVLIQWLK